MARWRAFFRDVSGIVRTSGRSGHHPVLGDLDLRSNSIGFLRFLFAAAVIWSHAYGNGGFGYDPLARLNANGATTGFLAVGVLRSQRVPDYAELRDGEFHRPVHMASFSTNLSSVLGLSGRHRIRICPSRVCTPASDTATLFCRSSVAVVVRDE